MQRTIKEIQDAKATMEANILSFVEGEVAKFKKETGLMPESISISRCGSY